jgi:branched-chain amino acid transport system permease protein
MREDETVAQAMGINVMRYKLLAFAIGAALPVWEGSFRCSKSIYRPEDHNLMVSINVLSLIIVVHG